MSRHWQSGSQIVSETTGRQWQSGGMLLNEGAPPSYSRSQGGALDFSDHRGGWVDPACPVEWGHPLNQGLVGAWLFVPNAGWRGGKYAYDAVRGGKPATNGTLTNMTTSSSGWDLAPNRLPALKLDGSNDYVDITGFTYNVTNAWIEAWIYPTALGGAIISGSADGTNGIVLSVKNFATSPGYSSTFGFHNPVAGEHACADANSITLNTWQHIVAAYPPKATAGGWANARFWVNGKPAGHNIGNTNTTGTGTTGSIGRSPQGGGQLFFAGRISQVAAFTGFPTDGVVAARYDQSCRGHPDTMRWVSTRAYSLPAAGGGTAYTQNLTGTLTYTNSNIKSTSKILNTSIVLASVIIKLISNYLVSTLNSSGTFLKSVSNYLINTLNPSGTFLKSVSNYLINTLTLNTGLVKAVSNFISATLSFAGSTLVISRSLVLNALLSLSSTTSNFVSKIFNTTVSFSANLVKAISNFIIDTLDLTGSTLVISRSLVLNALLSLSSTTSNFVSKIFNTTITNSVAFSKTVSNFISATLSFVGSTLIISRSLVLSAAITLASTLSKTSNKFLNVTFNLSTLLTKAINNFLGNTLTYSVLLTKNTVKNISNSFTISATFIKNTSKIIGTSLINTASFVKNISKNIFGSQILSGSWSYILNGSNAAVFYFRKYILGRRTQ